MIIAEVGQEDIGFWFFTVKDGDQLLHMEPRFRTREEAESAKDTWMRESDGSKRIKDGILEETRTFYQFMDEDGTGYIPSLVKWRENLETGQSWWRHMDEADWQETKRVP